ISLKECGNRCLVRNGAGNPENAAFASASVSKQQERVGLDTHLDEAEGGVDGQHRRVRDVVAGDDGTHVGAVGGIVVVVVVVVVGVVVVVVGIVVVVVVVGIVVVVVVVVVVGIVVV